jgi:hypothetical protein
VAARWSRARQQGGVLVRSAPTAGALIALGWLGAMACAGSDERPPTLGDFNLGGSGGSDDDDDDVRDDAGAGQSGSSTSGTAGSRNTGAGGSAGAAGTGGTAGTSNGGSGGTGSSDLCQGGTWEGDFTAYEQAGLSDLSGYSEVTGDLYIGGNIDLTTTDVSSLGALSCLETVTGFISIFDSPALVDLSGLEALRQAGRLSVTNNAGLVSLEGLNELVITGSLTVRSNPSLLTLGAGVLGTSAVVIGDNAALPQCVADAFAEQLGQECTCSENDDDATCP